MMISNGDCKPYEEWIPDSVCTFFMYPNQEWFTTYEVVSRVVVITETTRLVKQMELNQSGLRCLPIKTLSDVKHIPDLKRNLSLIILNSKEYMYTDKGGVLKVSRGTLVVI